ncbi:MAG: hypothetical protein Q4B09_06930, partial [Lachnospiraceae bacterium]|nr:hypothetical protein [Lachnospiraceae bacterium]
MKKRILALVLAQLMAVSGVISICADEESRVRASLEANEEALSSTRSALYELAVKKEEIQETINSLNSNLVDLMVQIEDAELQITETEEKIATTESDIEDTTAALEEAEANRDDQYDSMKKRIQYIYENGGNVGLMIGILESEDLTQFLGKQEYAEQLETADRDQLDELKATVSEVEELKSSLETQKEELETENGYLKAQKEDLDTQKEDLNTQIAENQSTSDDYAYQIEVAQEQAAALVSVISQQNQRLEEIEEEKQAEALAAAEAAARAEREAEAARRAAEEEESEDEDDEDNPTRPIYRLT